MRRYDVEMRRGAEQVRLRFAVRDDAADRRTAGRVNRGDAAFEPVGGSFDFPLIEKQRAEIDRGLGIVGRDRQRFAKTALGLLYMAAGLLRIAEIVQNFRRRGLIRRFRKKMHGGFVISTVETLESCQGFVGWGHGSSAIAGSDRPVLVLRR